MTASDVYTWRVACFDGTVFDEHLSPGWAVVPLDRAARLTLRPTVPGWPLVIIDAATGRGERLFFTRRRALTLSLFGDTSPTRGTTTIAGLLHPDGTASYTFILADRSILVSSQINAV